MPSRSPARCASANHAQRSSTRAGRTVRPLASSSHTSENRILESLEEIVVREIPQRPGVLTACRSDAARERSPERLHLDRRQLLSCPVLEGEERLRLVNYQNNSIGRIENLDGLQQLAFLDLYDNKVERIENLEVVPNLKVLMLGKNQVCQLENLDKLTRLDVLDLHSNRISEIMGLDHLKDLRVLNLAGNLIREVQNMSSLVSLTELNVRRNELTSMAGIDVLPRLQRIFASRNRVGALAGLENIKHLPLLSELALDGNPVCDVENYHANVSSLCPKLQTLDGKSMQEDSHVDASASLPGEIILTGVALLGDRARDKAERAVASDEARDPSPVLSQVGGSSGSASRPPSISGNLARALTSGSLPRNLSSGATRASANGTTPTRTGSLNGSRNWRGSGGLRSGSSRGSRPSSAGAQRHLAEEATSAGSTERSRAGESGGGGHLGEGRAREREGTGQKALSSHDVLQEIRAQWSQAVAAGRAPTIRYGYVRREQPNELAVYGRGLEALDKPEYQGVITSIHFNFIAVVQVLQDTSRLLKFQGLNSITFSRNLITSFKQLESLRTIPTLTALTIMENPICETRSALRLHAIRCLPQLQMFNGSEVTDAERETSARIFEPFDRLTSADGLSNLSARHKDPPSCHPQISALVDGLISHACAVDEKLRVVHVQFEAAVREAMREAWEDALAAEAERDGGRWEDST